MTKVEKIDCCSYSFDILILEYDNMNITSNLTFNQIMSINVFHSLNTQYPVHSNHKIPKSSLANAQ
jgi:hypothetical protein